MDANDEGASSGTKNMTKKISAKQTCLRMRKKGLNAEKSCPINVGPALIDCLRCIFRNPKDAKLMLWHACSKRMKDNGKLPHPSNGLHSKCFNAKLQEFGEEARTVRFALSSDGRNLFGHRGLRSWHNTWSVILTI